MNPKLSQLSKDLSYDIFCFNGIINLASSVVKPDMHLNLISKSARSYSKSKLFKDKLRLFQVTRTLPDSDKKSKIRQVNVLDSISFAAYKLFAKDFDMKKLSRILLRGRNATFPKYFSFFSMGNRPLLPSAAYTGEF